MAHFVDMEAPDEFKHMKVGEKRDLTPRKDGGVLKEVIKEGEGDIYPNAGDKVVLKYIGYKGEEEAEEYIFDSSEKDGKPFVFEVLRGQVVRGFEMAIMTMKKGERAKITLSPSYAFGKAGAPPRVPGGIRVLFDAEIISIDPEDFSIDLDRSITKHVLKKGKGWSQPNEGGMMSLSIKGCYHDDKGVHVFLDKECTFPYGEGSDTKVGIPAFVEGYLMEWKMEEISVLKMDAKHCYGDKGNPALGIPPATDLEFEIHMQKFERVKDIWEMDEKERMDQCEQFKLKGNDYFKKEEYSLARKFYQKVIDNLEFDMLMKGEDEERRKNILNTGFVNLAQTYLKEENYTEAKKCCDKVLKIQPDHIKACYRRGMANYATHEYKEALKDFTHVLSLEPSNKEAIKKKKLCESKIKESSGSEQELYKRMMASKGGSNDPFLYDSAMDSAIGDWDNSMARGMMTLEQEASAWDEALPPKGDNNHGAH